VELPIQAIARLANDSQARELVLCAPFIKLRAFERVIELFPPECKLTVFTRWNPDEILAGVSDPEIWEIVSSRAGSSLRLFPSLHAKYIRAGESCLVGSANLTGAGLGLSARANLEILCTPSLEFCSTEFEATLLDGSTPVNATIYVALESLLGARDFERPLSSEDVPSARTLVPLTRNPAYLFGQYSGQELPLPSSAAAIVKAELEMLAMPAGLSESSFRAAVGLQLLQSPFFLSFAEFCGVRRRFGEIRGWVATYLASTDTKRDSSRVTQSAIRWFVYFIPWAIDVSVPGQYSEVIRISLQGNVG
jgi:hypothetical protein